MDKFPLEKIELSGLKYVSRYFILTVPSAIAPQKLFALSKRFSIINSENDTIKVL